MGGGKREMDFFFFLLRTSTKFLHLFEHVRVLMNIDFWVFSFLKCLAFYYRHSTSY